MPRKSRWKVGALAFFGVCAASFCAALVSMGQDDWFGAPDFPTFAFWTLPFAFGVAMLCMVGSKLYFSGSIPLNYLFSTLVGLGLGTGYTELFVKLGGPDAGVFPTSLWASWALGGLVGAASTAFIQEGWGKWFQQTALVFGVGLAVAVVGLPRLMDQVHHDQTAAMCVLKWNPNAPELKIGTLARQSLTPKGVEFIGQQGIKGLLVNWGLLSSAQDDEDCDSMGIILLTKRPLQEVDLPQPDHCVILYIQDGDHWKKIPGDAPTLKRNLVLAPSETKPKTETQFWLEDANGDRQTGVLDAANDY